MRHFFLVPFLSILATAFYSHANAQTLFPANSTSYVAAYKEGTGCSATSYKFYTISPDSGTQSSTPFLSTSTTTEINGIGLNTDGYGYGIQYDRDGSCNFSNYKLIRFDAGGNVTSLGTIAPPQGGTSISAAIGFVVPSNRFVLFSTVSGVTYMGFINNIPALAASTGTLTPQYFPMTFNCTGKQYADFALNPVDHKFYTYGTYLNGASYEGTLMKLDPETQVVTCVGAAGTGIFTSGNDNFGGVMFDGNGDMIGLNINTKKLYKINVSTGTQGTVTYMRTLSASTGTIRGDLGSNAIGSTPIALPLALLQFDGDRAAGSDRLYWKTDNEPFASFQVQGSEDGKTFTTLGSVSGAQYESGDNATKAYVWRSAVAMPYYRLQMLELNGRASYSGIVSLGKTGVPASGITMFPNPASDKLTVELNEAGNTGIITLTDVAGGVMRTQTLSGGRATIELSGLPQGIYFAVVEYGGQRIARRISVQR